MPFDIYETDDFYDEMFQPDGTPRPSARVLFQRISALSDGELRRYQQAAEQALFRMGITFNVYGDEAGTEKIFPFDIIPRIVTAEEWSPIDRGLRQRVHALGPRELRRRRCARGRLVEPRSDLSGPYPRSHDLDSTED